MELLDLYNFISEQVPEIIAPNLFIVAAAVWLGIKIKQLRHPRYFMRFITFVILVLLIFNAIILEFASLPASITLSVLLVIYSITTYLASKKPILYSKRNLEHLRSLLVKGYSLNDENLFEKKPLYLIDYVENYEFQKLKAEHLRTLERFADAYEVYQSIDDKKLLEEERADLSRKKAFLLYTLGDMNKAKCYLSCIVDVSEPNYLMLKGMLEENAMNLEIASEYWQKALNVTSETKELLLRAMVYNNYGRLRFMEGNLTDAVSFYRQSYEIAKTQKNRELIHSSFQNLIHTSLQKGDKQKAMQFFQEYESLIQDKTLNDMREEFNLRVEIARQEKNNIEISKVIIDGYKVIHSLLSKERQIIFDVSILRMMFSNKMNFDLVMDRINDNYDNYFTLKMPEKYFALKEINIPLREVQFPYCHKYAIVHNRINEYMAKDAIEDIDVYLSSLKDYEVNQRCSMEREKVIVQKEWMKPYNFESIYCSMADIKDIYQKNGMLIESIFMDLDIADECYAPVNCVMNQIKPLPREKMLNHVEMAATSLKKLKKYPSVVEGNIRLAIYYMALNEVDKARKHFEESKIPVQHFAFWIQNGYDNIKHILSNNG
ncbi:MAG: tetratricopeptide repeat protein [Vallitaleaceae bacterium]|nr:tetratricopeptide repeat protein [Vallitaleaceae bacterium]